MIELCALWLNETKDGKKYMSGNLGNAKLMLFKNDYKKPGSKEPDYRLFLDEKPKEERATKSHASDVDEWRNDDRTPF